MRRIGSRPPFLWVEAEEGVSALTFSPILILILSLSKDEDVNPPPVFPAKAGIQNRVIRPLEHHRSGPPPSRGMRI